MKRITLFIAILTLLSCSNEETDCTAAKNEITARFETQLEDERKHHPVDYDKISLLIQERDNLIDNACN